MLDNFGATHSCFTMLVVREEYLIFKKKFLMRTLLGL
jgi:hypothetical protein